MHEQRCTYVVADPAEQTAAAPISSLATLQIHCVTLLILLMISCTLAKPTVLDSLREFVRSLWLCLQKAFLRSVEDQLAGRDPATFAAGRTIEFCIAEPQDCPGGAPVDGVRGGSTTGPTGAAGDGDEIEGSGADRRTEAGLQTNFCRAVTAAAMLATAYATALL